ncbi:MAG: TrbC/VirB2 family protein [Betaproteobacteria bacterium]|nr:TrbC/VirB2 family protein [Betaproteobacteria bacterium]MDE2353485.1 TrbC/VirB2 family protein [Betaproteobacteria bacterium]
MKRQKPKKRLSLVWLLGGFVLLLPVSALALYTPMPWEGPICAVASSLKGQVAVVLSVVATIMIGIMFMYAETGGIVARIASWLLGMSCALSVVSIITALFPGVAMPGCL